MPAVGPDELREVRSRFLADCGWASCEEVLADLAQRDEMLAQAEELVLWFERDLYDQLQLLQILDRLDGRPATLVVVDGSPRCREELQALHADRTEIDDPQEEFARGAWAAFRSSDPAAVEDLLEAGTGALPDLGPALERHLEQLPAVENGLSRTERQIVEALVEGATRFEEVFRASQKPEQLPFMGDAAFALHLERLAGGRTPLVESRNPGYAVTEAGIEVLAERADYVSLNGLDRWLGGVHLEGERAAWRWDSAARRLVRQA